MRRDDLVCANCAGPVFEGRCSVCRASRDQYGRGGGQSTARCDAARRRAALVCALALQAHFA